MDSRPGLYDSVLVLDYKSLYPSIIRTFLIDPVGLIEGLREPDDAHSVAGFRGARFSRTRHALPAMVERVWQGREAAKRAGNAALSLGPVVLIGAGDFEDRDVAIALVGIALGGCEQARQQRVKFLVREGRLRVYRAVGAQLVQQVEGRVGNAEVVEGGRHCIAPFVVGLS